MVMMSGIAMFTMVRSSSVMKNPSETTSSTAHGFAWNFLTACSLLPGAVFRLVQADRPE